MDGKYVIYVDGKEVLSTESKNKAEKAYAKFTNLIGSTLSEVRMDCPEYKERTDK